MQLSENRSSEILAKVVPVTICLGVAFTIGLIIPRVHFLVSVGSLLALSLAVLFLASGEVGVLGLLIFAPMVDLMGRALALPMGVNEFNILFGMLIFTVVAQYTITKRWVFRIYEPTMGVWLYALAATLLLAALRTYLRPDVGLVLDALRLESRKSLLTSQFVKPIMYVGMFFVAYNYGRLFANRRRYVVVMGWCLMVYVFTMALQFAGVMPLFSNQLGKATGGVLGMSNTLGTFLSINLVLFLGTAPYFRRGLAMAFPYLVATVVIGGLMFTLSRTGWVLAAAGICLFVLTVRQWGGKLIAVGAVGLLLVTTPLWVPERMRDYWFETTTAQVDDPNAVLSGRVQIWTAAWDYLTSDPVRLLVGGGAMDFRYRGPEYGLFQGFHTHHALIEVLVNQGGLGLFVLIGIFGRVAFVLQRTWRSGQTDETRQLGRLLLIITVLFVASGIEPTERTAAWYWFLLGLFAAAVETAAPPNREALPSRHEP